VDERSADILHLRWNDVPLSMFVLPFLVPFVADRCLNATGILATRGQPKPVMRERIVRPLA
jgi:hypothetical protein